MKMTERRTDLILSFLCGETNASAPCAQELARRRRRLVQMARRSLYPVAAEPRTQGEVG